MMEGVMAGQLELDEIQRPFQTKPLRDKMIL